MWDRVFKLSELGTVVYLHVKSHRDVLLLKYIAKSITVSDQVVYTKNVSQSPWLK